MPVVGFDHAAIPAGDAEAMIAFYRRLGFTILGEAEWRSGASRIFSRRGCPACPPFRRGGFALAFLRVRRSAGYGSASSPYSSSPWWSREAVS